MGSGGKIQALDLLLGNDVDDIRGVHRDIGLGNREQYKALTDICLRR